MLKFRFFLGSNLLVSCFLLFLSATPCPAAGYLTQICINISSAIDNFTSIELAVTGIDEQRLYYRLDGSILNTLGRARSGVTGAAFLSENDHLFVTLDSLETTSSTGETSTYFFDFTSSNSSYLIAASQHLVQDVFNHQAAQVITGQAVLDLCGNAPPDPRELDLDQDGYSGVAGDCNDNDPDIFPAAVDTPGDGIDQDCNPATDSMTTDDDGDGYSEIQGDCDDNNANVNPGEEDNAFYQFLGIDRDCNPATFPLAE